MTAPDIDFRAHAPKAVAHAPADLLRLAMRQIDLETHVTEAKGRLKELEAELQQLREGEFPDAMMAAGVTEFPLPDSTYRVRVDEFMHCSLSDSRPKMQRAVAFVRELFEKRKDFFGKKLADQQNNKIGAVVEITFDKGHAGDASHLAAKLQHTEMKGSKGIVVKEQVNTGTFKSLVRKALAASIPVPMEDMGIYAGRSTVIFDPSSEADTNSSTEE